MFLLIDEASKIILDNVLSLGKSITIFDKFLYITKVYNDGISFSMLTGKRWLIVFFSILILIFLYFYMKKFKENKRNTIAFSLIFGGLLGNLIDRVFRGYVVDFISFILFNKEMAIFNVADAFITIGVVILLIYIFKEGKYERSNNK